ncbi:MAG: Rubrerythrin [Deltaproteobacteria bacterium]|nr:Rubrerythrin [Deltaproteobacteria bacterium]
MTTQGIDFSKLSLQDALDLAILIEEQAQERYEEFTQQMELHHTPDAATFFRHMAQNEAKHGAELSKRRTRLFADAPRRVKASMLWDVEAPEYDEARALMTPRQAMQTALRSEEKAHAFFVAVLPQIADPDVKALFEELRDEEVEHQDLVKTELAKLPPGPDVNPDDYADEPVGQ